MVKVTLILVCIIPIEFCFILKFIFNLQIIQVKITVLKARCWILKASYLCLYDRPRLFQSLENLLTNSIRKMDTGL